MIDWFMHLTTPIQIGIICAVCACVPLTAVMVYRGGVVVLEFIVEVLTNIDWGGGD